MNWTPADKQGFGTSTTRASRVWFTLEKGELTEVYFPRIDTPSFRDLQFVVTDGHSFVEPERTSTRQRTVLVDRRSLTYRQIDTDVHHRWRLTKTYVTDPRRSSVLIRVGFQSLTRRPYHLYVVANPQLSNATQSESGVCADGTLVADDAQMSSAIRTAPRLRQVSCGFKGTSDGLTDLREHRRLTWHYRLAPKGNVVQTGLTSLTGLGRHRTLTVALGFAKRGGGSLAAASASLKAGWPGVERRYEAGWHRYLAGLGRPPRSLRTTTEEREYRVSAMVLAASEDKTYRGAYVASPTMPWAWGTGLQNPSGPYHLVWSRDLYEISTALIADGDVAGARRALHFLFYRQQEADGAFPQNSQVNGKPALTNLQLDEVADPIILAWQLREHSRSLWTHVKRAADFIVGWHDSQGDQAPYSPQERWENQGGYSPATIASEIAGLVCAASIAERNGDHASASRYLQTADAWQHNLNKWTLTTTGPYGGPYYLRLTKNGDPNSGMTYNVGDSGPTLDQRAVVDPSFLEMVRLGVKSPRDPDILNTIRVVDTQLGFTTPNGEFWHRYTDDGYGEQRDGQPWNVGFPPGSRTTIGRLWPIFAGERGEYQVDAGQPAAGRLKAMAAVHNAGWLLPEQVWDQNPPSGPGRFQPGTPTFSATPLAWSQAQFIRLAWSIAERRVVEQPSVVACRYVRKCR
jgi:glucoamylase